MFIKDMKTTDIKIMLTSMNNQIENSPYYSRLLLKEYYKDHIEACENELKKRGKNYESCNISR